MIYDEFVDNVLKQNKFIKVNDKITLKESQIEILKKYQIPYETCNSINEIIYLVEEILETDSNIEDLENVSTSLSEFDYYNNYRK